MRKAIVALVVAVAAVAVWFGLTHNEAPAPPTTGAHAATQATETPSSEHGAVTGDTEAATTTQLRQGERVAAPASFSGPGADILVVEFGSDTPIADAEVLCWPPDFDWQKLTPTLRRLFTDDREAALRQLQPPCRSDAAGRCRVPLGKDQTQVIAKHGDRRAEGWLTRETPQPYVLALRPDRTLRVRVRFADGAPARGLNVMATREADKTQFGVGITDGDGRATYPHLQELAGDEAARLQVRAEYPGGASEPVAVVATDPPDEILLRLPACGKLIVHVRDRDGAPLDPRMLEDARVDLTVWSQRPTDSYAENNVTGRGQAPIDANGDATFDAIAFGQMLRVTTGHSIRSAIVNGPTAAEPRVELVLQEDASHVVCTGVLRTDGGQPYTGAFQLFLRFSRGMVSATGRPDAAGRFRLGLGDLAAGQRSEASFDTLLASRQTGDPALAAALPARDMQKGINDLGEVRLAPHAVLLQGRFEGEELPERLPLHLQFEVQRDNRWDTEWNLQPVWSDHAFTVTSAIASGTPMRLKVNTQTFLPIAPIEFTAGATGMVIPLRRGGSVAAWFLVDAGVPTDDLRIELRPGDAPPPDANRQFDEQHRWRGSKPIDGKLGRSWQGLTPGRYRLEARAPGSAEPLVVVDAVDVTDGPCKDERLQAIDLRGRLRALTIRATTAEGSAIATRDAFVVVRDGTRWSGHNLGAGEVTLAAAGPLDLLVSAPQHEVVLLDGVLESRTVTLAAAATTTLVIAWPEPLPAGITARLSLQPDAAVSMKAQLTLDTGRGMPASSWFEEQVDVGADGRATLHGRCRGGHRLQLGLRNGNDRQGLKLVPPTIVLPANAEIPVQIEPASWTRAMQSWRR